MKYLAFLLFVSCVSKNNDLKLTSTSKFCYCYTDSINYKTVVYSDSLFNGYILKRTEIDYDKSIKCDTIWYEQKEFSKLQF